MLVRLRNLVIFGDFKSKFSTIVFEVVGPKFLNALYVSQLNSVELEPEINSKVCRPKPSPKFIQYDFKASRPWIETDNLYSDLLENRWKNYTVSKNSTNQFSTMRPSNCESKQCVAFLIPARDREYHLKQIMYHLPKLLTNQLACFGIYILDQFDSTTVFNKAKLFNAGWLEARKDNDWDCYVFHDVDLLLQNETIEYTCDLENNQPKHLTVAIDKYGYKLSNLKMVGGASLMSEKIIRKINGWSNSFWGWGGEDDNMFFRLKNRGFKLTRPSFDCVHPHKRGISGINCGMWQMIRHSRDKGNPLNNHRKDNMKKTPRDRDGLMQTEYVLKMKELRHNGLFSYLLIDVLAPSMQDFQKINQLGSVKEKMFSLGFEINI